VIGFRTISSLTLAAAFAAGVCAADAQSSFSERLMAHNSSMTAYQPAFIPPLVSVDPRLLQFVRASFSNQFTAAGTQTVSYGNGRGVGVIVGHRFEFDFVPPSYIRHNVSTAVDGLGDTSVLAKYRIASGNAQHGNFAVAALLSHSFATGTYKNGAKTDVFCPTLAGGYAFRRFVGMTSLGGTMPTGKIAAQGRSIVWNSVAQVHASKHVWFEVENNATYYFSGSHDGVMQNFVTPAAYYVVRPKAWKPTHPFFVLVAGMQVATSRFHTYNHNTICELRFLY